MAIDIRPPRLESKKSPREILAADFKSLRGELPIHGGWGYSKEDPVIIDRNDPVVPEGIPFNGVGFEYIFVEKRIYEELIIFRSQNQRFSGITWNLLEQKLIPDGDRTYDVLKFTVSAIPDRDWEELKAEWEGLNGFESAEFDVEAHLKKKEVKTICYTTEYWFDITSFYGR